jgi:hypothetical protein
LVTRLSRNILFHLEADLAQVQAMCRAFDEELQEAKTSMLALVGATGFHEQATRGLAAKLFGEWIELVVGDRSEASIRNERIGPT